MLPGILPSQLGVVSTGPNYIQIAAEYLTVYRSSLAAPACSAGQTCGLACAAADIYEQTSYVPTASILTLYLTDLLLV